MSISNRDMAEAGVLVMCDTCQANLSTDPRAGPGDPCPFCEGELFRFAPVEDNEVIVSRETASIALDALSRSVERTGGENGFDFGSSEHGHMSPLALAAHKIRYREHRTDDEGVSSGLETALDVLRDVSEETGEPIVPERPLDVGTSSAIEELQEALDE